jgi:hypothetical protein
MASDFPCDPLFEVCEEAATKEEMGGADDLYSDMYKPALEIEQYSLLWGGATAGMLTLAVYYYFEYNYQIWTDNKYPYRYQGVNAYDKDWALSTKEISAWSKGIVGIYVLHGLGMFAWVMNILFDNKGGLIHYIFYRWV